MTAGAGVNVQIALKNADTGAVFYLAAPCPLDAGPSHDRQMDGSFIARWKAIDDANESYATVADLPRAFHRRGGREAPLVGATPSRGARCRQVGSEVALLAVQLLGPEAERVRWSSRSSRASRRARSASRQTTRSRRWGSRRSARCCGRLDKMVGWVMGGAGRPAGLWVVAALGKAEASRRASRRGAGRPRRPEVHEASRPSDFRAPGASY